MSMKKFVILLAVLFVSVICNAQSRTDAEMDSIALSVLGQNAQFAKGRAKEQMIFDKERLENLTVLSNGSGAVIVSNGKDAVPVLGYTFDYHAKKELPCGYKWWLEAINQSLSKNNNLKVVIAPPSNFPSKVEPILTCHWHQNSPYNSLCPKNTIAGCVAIALAQILYTYKYPVHGLGQKSYIWKDQTLSANFENTYYDWEHMLDKYSNKSYTDQQKYAVSELVYHCGVAVSMYYGFNASSASNTSIRYALINHFDYQTETYKCRSSYSNEEWMKMIFSDLSQGKPIAYKGENEEGQTGHAFVLDGYDAKGLIHVNWGWGGSEDGYYDLSLIWSHNQEMIHGITPQDNTIDKNTYLSVQHAMNGSIQMVVEKEESYEYKLEPADGWHIHSVTFNGKDVTSELTIDNDYKTPVITANSSLNVAYEKTGSKIVLNESQLRVNAYGNVISITHAENGELITVYNVDGKNVTSMKTDKQGSARFVLPENQTYIVKGQYKTVKVRL